MAYLDLGKRVLPVGAAVAFALAAVSAPAMAQEAVSRFQSNGSAAQGTEYSAAAVLPGADISQAYAALRRVVERNGWNVFQATPASYALLARNNQTTQSGKTGSLAVSLAPVGDGVSLALMYANPPGVNSPPAAVRAEFNKIAGALKAELAALPAGQPAVTANATAAAPQPASAAPDRKLCLAGACLGMTTAEAATLNLQPSGIAQFKLNGKPDGAYGLDRSGNRIGYSDMGDFDSKSLKQFATTVATVCRFSFASASMKASDGQRIRLVFRPAIRDGKGVVVLTEINRQLPPNMSSSELQRFTDTARQQFGDAFSAESRVIVTRPTAEIHRDVGLGTSLKLSLPIENVNARLLEQPGCSDKPRLD
ncbi:hypothetical protein [Duganella levis]|uniref:Uncharacterized protein n=1 Tax=Duganella levis TaxID=2692169 RepID=A0ABW9W7X2_9BURK|nr:hypothetical protein [Duganella levis]MYN29610.1 hypothetical protein [Duganella levis]